MRQRATRLTAIGHPRAVAAAARVLDFATLTPAALASRFGWTLTGAGTMQNAAGLVVAGPQDGATYLMRSPDYSFGVPGLLLEGARTNLAPTTEDFSVWLGGSIIVSQNAILGPDGLGTADKLTEAANTDQHYKFRQPTFSAGWHTFACFLKAGERTWAILNCARGSVFSASFNLTTGAVGTQTNCVGKTTAYPNGWWRCEITFNVTAAGNGDYGVVTSTGNNVFVYAGDGVSGLFAWGAQLEAGAYPTSYIPNSGTGTVLRAGDVAEIGPGAEFDELFPAAQGTLVVEWVDLGATEGDMLALHSNGTTNELISMYYTGSSILTLCRAGSANQLAATLGTRIPNAVNKAAISWGPAGLSAVLNGGTVQANASATIPAPTHARWAGAGLASGSQAAWKPTKRTVLTAQTTGAALQALTV